MQHSSKQYVSLGCEYAIQISLLADGEIRRRGTCRLVCFGYRLFDGDCWSNGRTQARAAVCNSSTWRASSKNLLSVFQKLTYIVSHAPTYGPYKPHPARRDHEWRRYSLRRSLLACFAWNSHLAVPGSVLLLHRGNKALN